MPGITWRLVFIRGSIQKAVDSSADEHQGYSGEGSLARFDSKHGAALEDRAFICVEGHGAGYIDVGASGNEGGRP